LNQQQAVAVHQAALSQQQQQHQQQQQQHQQQQQQSGATGDGTGPGANGAGNMQTAAPTPTSSQEVGTQMDPVAAPPVGPDQHQVKDEVKPTITGCAKDMRNLPMPG
jgi:hypothetical protein